MANSAEPQVDVLELARKLGGIDDAEMEELASMSRKQDVDDDDEESSFSSTTAVEEVESNLSDISMALEPPDDNRSMDPDPPAARGRNKQKPGPKRNPFERLVPSPERLLIYKRRKDGRLGFVAEFSPADLARSGSIEVFLKEYVVESWGHGEFALTIQGADGKQKPMGSITIEAPMTKGSENSIAEIIDLQTKMQEKAKREADDSMKNMLQMMTMMQKGTGQQAQSAESSFMPMMMMMMMMNRPQPQDNTLSMILPLLLKNKEESSAPPFLPQMMLPAPAPQQDSTDLIKTLLPLLRNQQPTPLADMLTAMKVMKSDDSGDRLTIKDMITLLPAIKEAFSDGKNKQAPGGDEFRKTVENLAIMQNLMAAMGGGGGATEGNFWNFASALIENGPAIAKGLVNSQAQPHPQQRPKQMPAQVAQQQQAPQQRTLPTPTQQDVILNRSQVQANDEVPPIPTPFNVFARKMNIAADKEEWQPAVENYLRGLLYLRKENEKWKIEVEEALRHAKELEQDRFMEKTEDFLSIFVDAEILRPETAEYIFDQLQEHWDAVLSAFGFKKKAKPESKESNVVPITSAKKEAEPLEASEASEATEPEDAPEDESLASDGPGEEEGDGEDYDFEEDEDDDSED